MNKQPSQWFKSGKSEDLNVCIYVHTIYIYIRTNYIYIILFSYRHTIFQTHHQEIHANMKQLLLFRTQLQPDSCPQNCSHGTSSTSMLHQQIDSQKANENELVVWNILAKLDHFPKKRGENSEKMFELLPPRKLADMDWTLRAPISANRQRTSNFPPQKIKNTHTHTKQTSSKLTVFFLLPAKNETLGCRFSLSNKAWFNLTRLHQVSSCSPPVSFPRRWTARSPWHWESLQAATTRLFAWPIRNFAAFV